MADVPRRVNAAQLAARKIKSGGSLRKKLGTSKADDGESVPQWATPGQSFNPPTGGLFGGAVSAGGGFSFSVPGPNISFGSPSGSTTPTEQTNNEDPRADTTGEEAARRNKPFRLTTEPLSTQPTGTFSFGQSSNAPNSASVFQTSQSPLPTNSFSFGSTSTTNEPSKKTLFSFGQNAQSQPASTPFSFETPDAMDSESEFPTSQSLLPSSGISFGSTFTVEHSANTPVPFGQITQSQPASASFSFGNTAPNNAPSNPFAFGQSSSQPTTSFGFGSSSQDKNTTTPFAFGQSMAAAQPASTGISFGSTPATKSYSFGQSSSTSNPVSSSIGFGSTPATEKPASAIFSFGQTGAASQSASTGVGFGSTPATPTVNLFSFGQSSGQTPVATSGNNTESTPAVAQPASNPFSFGQSQPHVNPPTPNFTFGSSSTQSKPSTGLFGSSQTPSLFGNSVTQQIEQTKTTDVGFGNKEQTEKPASLFGSQVQNGNAKPLFGGASNSAASTDGGFGNQEKQSEKPASSLFGPQVQKGSITSLFGGTSNSATPTEGVSAKQEKQPEKPVSSLFGSQGQNGNTTSLFGGTSGSGASTNGIFGNQTQSTSKANLFGSQSTQSPEKEASPEKDASVTSDASFGSQATTTSLFGNKSQDAPKKLLGGFSPTKPTTPAPNGIFGNKTQQSTPSSNIFGQSSQPQPAKPTNESAPTSASASEFGENNPASSLFSSLRPHTASTSHPGFPASGQKPASSVIADEPAQKASTRENEQSTTFGSLAKKPESTQNSTSSTDQPPKHNFFASMKPAAASTAPSVSSFPNLQPPAKSDATNIFAKSSAVQQATPATMSTSTALQKTSDQETIVESVERVDDSFEADIRDIGEFDEKLMESRVPKHFTAAQKAEFRGAYSIRALNAGLQSFLASLPMGADYAAPLEFYKKRRDEIVTTTQNTVRAVKRKADDGGVRMLGESPNKRPKNEAPSFGSQSSAQPASHFAPNQNKPAFEAAPARSLFQSPTKPGPSASSSTTPKAPPPVAPQFSAQPATPVSSPTPKGKRKAEVQLTKDDPTGEEEESRSIRKQHQLKNSFGGSETSNIFRNIVEGGSSSSSPSKAKLPASQSPDKSTGSPKPNPFAAIPAATPATSVNGPTPTVETGKLSFGAASSGLTTNNGGFASKTTADSSSNASSTFSIFGASANQASAASNPSVGNMFSGSLSNSSDPTSNLQTAKNSTSETEGDSSASHNASSSVFEPKPTEPTSTNLFGSKGTAAAPTTKSFFQFKPSTGSPLANSFTPPASGTDAKAAASGSPASTGIKPPTFGSGPVNFLAQFGQQAQKDKEDAEKKAMERAKLEDLDSDDDEAEWEANWKKKREEEKKAIEELAKSKKAAFVPGKGFSFNGSNESVEPTKQTSSGVSNSNIFGNSTSAASSNANSFASRSGASSPGAASNGSGSVFDHIASSIPPSFSGNIFGHLSDVDSGADRKGNDADDDTTEGEGDGEESGPEQYEEKKDPTYKPDTEGLNEPSTPGTPGTPPEITEPGIASAKKPTESEANDSSTPSKPSSLFNFTSTTTPATAPRSGGLFDRISKDSNGNPIRHVPTENKENAGPNTTNIFTSTPFGASGSNPFAAVNKTPGEVSQSPGDNTWKPDTPIKFGNATSPTVNVTTATPAQASPFAGLFGSNNTPKPTLFANLNANKTPTVGFAFGSSSTAVSSLAPSGVLFNTTSRATSPGATTDNDSTNDASGDPDAEHHEQVDLTKGGVGEEDEDVLHEVRAKALKFFPPKSDGEKSEWKSQGLGPLKVLKHKQTKVSRVLLRADPSGKVVLNKAVLEKVNYEATGKTIKLLTADDDGKGLETWLLQVKTEPMAKELANILETNKKK